MVYIYQITVFPKKLFTVLSNQLIDLTWIENTGAGVYTITLFPTKQHKTISVSRNKKRLTKTNPKSVPLCSPDPIIQWILKKHGDAV